MQIEHLSHNCNIVHIDVYMFTYSYTPFTTACVRICLHVFFIVYNCIHVCTHVIIIVNIENWGLENILTPSPTPVFCEIKKSQTRRC